MMDKRVVVSGRDAVEIALRALAGHRLFPMAAPSGGTLLIGGWALLAVAALSAGMRTK
jgi:uncharacterized membrane protein YgdD (TMEM256/DUF423 family)